MKDVACVTSVVVKAALKVADLKDYTLFVASMSPSAPDGKEAGSSFDCEHMIQIGEYRNQLSAQGNIPWLFI